MDREHSIGAPASGEPAEVADPTQASTLAAMFAARVRATPEGAAYREYLSGSGWVTVSWRDIGQRVARFRAALLASGLRAGDAVAVLLPNGLDAVCVDQAALSLGMPVVPMHQMDNPASVAWILADSRARLLVAATPAAWRGVASAGIELPALARVVVAQPDAPAAPASADDARMLPLAQWLAAGSEAAVAGALSPAADGADPAPGPAPSDVAGIVYTSGTTGKPKGVLLSHANIVSNIRGVMARVRPVPRDVFLSFLPLSHTFERTAGYYLPIAAGSCVCFARSVQTLADDLKEQRPTVLVSVPRIYERFHAQLMAHLSASPLRQRMFELAESVGWRRFRRRQHLPLAPEDSGPATALLDKLAWPVLERLAARPVLALFGGRVRVAVSGGAPLAPAIARCFLGLGLPLLQGYGMTETSPVVSANTLEDNDPRTVGRPLPEVQLRIGARGELFVRGPGVMLGYLNRPEETARTLSADGWLATGDQAAIEDGRLVITGRLKDIIVTSTGEKVPPADLELAIAADPFFAQVWVSGENRPFLVCVAVLERAGWQALAAEAGVPADEMALTHPAVEQAALAHIHRATASFPYYAQPRAVVLSLQPWTPDNGLLTPTLKLKRNNLATRYAAPIEAAYARKPATSNRTAP